MRPYLMNRPRLARMADVRTVQNQRHGLGFLHARTAVSRRSTTDARTHFSGILSRLFMVFSCVKCELISVASTISITKCRKFLRTTRTCAPFEEGLVSLVFIRGELRDDVVLFHSQQTEGSADVMILEHGSIVVDQSNVRSKCRARLTRAIQLDNQLIDMTRGVRRRDSSSHFLPL